MDFQFKDYKDEKPESKGWYVWRLPHQFLEGVTVVFISKMRWRGAGYKDVLSPSFDYWDGYSVHLPKGKIEWAEYNGEPPKPGRNLIRVEGADNHKCPFCKKVPNWRYSGLYIGAEPNKTDYFYLECCGWADTVRMKNPIKLSETRNNLLSGNDEVKVD